MTSLHSNTPATNANTIMSMSSNAAFANKTNAANTVMNYTISKKNVDTKTSFRLSSIDWDVNMNELEFE